MTPLHILAAAAVGTVIGATALSAPNASGRVAVQPAPTCTNECADPGILVGEIAPKGATHLITRPGRYGLATPPDGDAYAILRGYIVRLDPGTDRIRSVLRPAPQILD